jgi:hypothetical protein
MGFLAGVTVRDVVNVSTVLYWVLYCVTSNPFTVTSNDTVITINDDDGNYDHTIVVVSY